MREYKLLKWYPSLPTEWNQEWFSLEKRGFPIIVVEKEDGYYLHPSLKGLTRETVGLTKYEVEESEGYWEKVIPKEFEVVKRQNFPCKGVSNGGTYDVIESVKRLSDGVIFSIGDLVTSDFKNDGVQTIQSLEEKGDYISVRLGKRQEVNFVVYRKVHAIKHYNEAFTTTDNLELIAGDRYYVPQVEGKLKRLTGYKIMFYVEPDMPEDNTKRFAKKENAQAYIESNIELFSAKNIHELLKKYSRMMVDSSIYLELNKMVKEKLKN